MVSLIAYIESTFGIEIDDDELVPDNFETLDSMESFIRLKKGE